MTTLSFFPCKFLNLPRELAFAKDSSNAKKKIINTVTTLNGFVSFIFLIEVLEVNGPFVFIYYSLMRCQAVLDVQVISKQIVFCLTYQQLYMHTIICRAYSRSLLVKFNTVVAFVCNLSLLSLLALLAKK